MATHTTAGVRLRTRDLTYIALFAVLMAVCAWISIPVTAVSFTLQTFAIFAALMILGGRRGTYAVAAYLLLGAGSPREDPRYGQPMHNPKVVFNEDVLPLGAALLTAGAMHRLER